MADGASIEEHMEVVGLDGEHVGTVDYVVGDRIRLTKNDPAAGGRHRYIPVDMVALVEGEVRLTRPARQVRQQWQAA